MRIQTVLFTAAVAALAAPGAAGAAPGDFSSGLGCSAQCITSATVVPMPNRARIVVRTDTRAKIEVVLRKRSAMGGDTTGGLTTGAIVASRTSKLRRKLLRARVRGLQPRTLYAISVAATDSQGRRNIRHGTFRTPGAQTIGAAAGSGGLISNAGCTAQCIRTAEAVVGVTSAKVRVRTNVPAKLQINPGGGAPGVATSQFSTDATVSLSGLKAGKTYNVGVRATDANGGLSVRTGVIKMDQRNVRVRYYEIHVIDDGDHGKRNRGELTFFGALNGDFAITRGEGKVKSGSDVHFSNQGEIEAANVGRILRLDVQGVERDRKGLCFDQFSAGPFLDPLHGAKQQDCIRRTWNTASGQIDLDDLLAEVADMDPDLPWGFGGFGGHMLNTTIDTGRGDVRFAVKVGVDVWTQ